MLTVIMLSVAMLNVTNKSFLPSVIMLSVVMLNVVAPLSEGELERKLVGLKSVHLPSVSAWFKSPKTLSRRQRRSKLERFFPG